MSQLSGLWCQDLHPLTEALWREASDASRDEAYIVFSSSQPSLFLLPLCFCPDTLAALVYLLSLSLQWLLPPFPFHGGSLAKSANYIVRARKNAREAFYWAQGCSTSTGACLFPA